MGRPVVLSNGALFVGLNEQGLVHDFYFPYIGLDNLTTARSIHHKIGVWVEDKFSWVDDGSWHIEVDFEPEALISTISMRHDALGIGLHFQDFVDHEFNAFARLVTVTNVSDHKRTVSLFMHQVFQISSNGRGDTALFEPDGNYILDYKGRCSLLSYGQTSNNKPFDQFAIGNYAIEGKEGTYKDAEDGQLSGNPVEHGGVDSVFRLNVEVDAGAKGTAEYWVIAADSQVAAEKIHHHFLSKGLHERYEATKRHWNNWLLQSSDTRQDIDEKYREMTTKSLLIIKAHADKRGGILASGDSSIYNYGRDYYSYVWPRDGAYAIWPLIRMGYFQEARLYFEFCRDIISPDGYMMHKYQPDRAIGSTWHPLLHGKHKELAIQEDETAIVLYMLGEYHRHSQDTDFVQKMYDTFIKPAASFMADFIDDATSLPHASYDLWEEKFLTTTYSTAIIYQALLVACQFSKDFGHPDDGINWEIAAEKLLQNESKFRPEGDLYVKGLLLNDQGELTYDSTLDISSVYGVAMFGYRNDSSASALMKTVQKIEHTLLDKTPSGGLPRYENDAYFASDPPYKGNPWFVSTLWLSQYYLRTNNIERAIHYIDWTMKHAYRSGVLSEQINPTDETPVSVAPLVWSHAEFVNTILDLTQIKQS